MEIKRSHVLESEEPKCCEGSGRACCWRRLAVVGLALWAGAQVEPTGSRMAVAADRFVESLTPTQVAKATYPYDSPERLNWHFIPAAAKGCRSRS